jgi:Zn-dependent M28 family amino/carboxypeptidase
MVVELADRFASPDQPGKSILDHTRLVFLSFDAEEAGVRGSRAWVRAHQTELAALPTTLFNIDSIYRAEDVQLMLSDLNSHVRLDRQLAQTCVDLAHAAGLKAGFGVMRFGGGATDAVNFAKAGVSATTLIAMSSQIVRDGLVYHTMRDTVDAIEPAAVEACLTVAERLAYFLDRD